MEFRQAIIIKGQGLCKVMVEIQGNEENGWENETELHMIDVCPLFIALESWYRDLVHYLQ